MAYRDKSNQSGDVSETTIKLDLIRKGYVVLEPSSRDCVYDLVVDMGGTFETVQCKTMQNNSITKIVDRSNEVVCAGGKTRNSLDYAEHGVHWLAGCHKETAEVYYYKLKTYAAIPGKSFSVLKNPQDGFPSRNVPNRHAKKRS